MRSAVVVQPLQDKLSDPLTWCLTWSKSERSSSKVGILETRILIDFQDKIRNKNSGEDKPQHCTVRAKPRISVLIEQSSRLSVTD
jgi:hypothetical protein